jgi:glycosyltransferase involved in cell wall biosynthesis
MKILVAHNSYQQAGGEDRCVADEVALLQAYGHQVTQYRLSNDTIDGMNRLALASRTIWSRSAFGELRELFRTHRPQVAHFHNTFPLMSAAAYSAARSEGVPVVQTLHNFRLCCANALLFRDGEVCEACLGKMAPWRGIVHKCYRDSRSASAAVATMIAVHRTLGTWRSSVDVYIALTESSRRKLVEGGLPAQKIAIKPNFTYPDPGRGTGNGNYAVYVGRLSAEKGITTLLDAWRRLENVIPLRLVGDGPMAAAVQSAASRSHAIEWIPGVPHKAVLQLIGEAQFLVLPSECYETFARVVMEAFAKGTPVIVSGLGAMAEIVEDGHTGLHFAPGNACDLAEKARAMLADASRLRRMRQSARKTFEENFTADANHKVLMEIYDRAMSGRFVHGCSAGR